MKGREIGYSKQKARFAKQMAGSVWPMVEVGQRIRIIGTVDCSLSTRHITSATIVNGQWAFTITGDDPRPLRVLSKDGWAAEGARPKAFNNCAVGDKVTFTATVSEIQADKNLVIYKRPLAARYISQIA